MNDNISETKKQYISMAICWLAYVAVYLARYSYVANIALIERECGVSHASAGLVMTFFSAGYGAGQVIHGIFCKHYPKRYIVSAALLVAAVMDLLVFIGVPFYLIKYLWLINALCQSLLWPVLMQIISENVSGKLMKTGVLVMATTTSFGILFTYGLSAVVSGTNYRLTFLLGAIVIAVVAIVWFVLYEPGNYISTKLISEEKNGMGKFLIPKSLIYPVLLLLVFSIITSFVKDGIQTWIPVIIKAIKPELGDGFSILLTLVLPVFGIFGATLAVAANKKIAKIIPLTMFFMMFAGIFNLVILLFGNNLALTVISFGILELFMHSSANAIVSVFPLSMREKMSSGALTGILNGSAYIGSASSSYFLGRIADVSGWPAVFATLLGAICSALLLGAVYLAISVRHKEMNV